MQNNIRKSFVKIRRWNTLESFFIPSEGATVVATREYTMAEWTVTVIPYILLFEVIIIFLFKKKNN